MAWAHNNASAACDRWNVACRLVSPSSSTTIKFVRKQHSLSLGRQRPFPSDCSNPSILDLLTSSPQLWTVKTSVAHECCPDSFLSKVALLVLVASATGTPCLCRCLSRRLAPGRSFASCHLRESASLLVVSCAAGTLCLCRGRSRQLASGQRQFWSYATCTETCWSNALCRRDNKSCAGDAWAAAPC